MKRPILVPGHPGDLIEIMAVAAKALADLRARAPSAEEREARLRAIAETHHEALEMWLGLRPVVWEEDGA
jgi:hypothetical protein